MATTQKKSGSERWDGVRIEPNQALRWQTNSLAIWCQRIERDWLLAKQEDCPDAPAQPIEFPGYVPLALNWTRWPMGERDDLVLFKPALPDRPLVIKTRIPIMALPETTLELYINIPVWVEVCAAGAQGQSSLRTFPGSRLFNAWYGDHFSGELCYQLKSRARRSFNDLDDEPMRAICLFSITNRTDQPIPIEKIKVEPGYLRLFGNEDRLWCSSISVTVNGGGKPHRIEYAAEPPAHASKPALRREAAKPARHGSFFESIGLANIFR